MPCIFYPLAASDLEEIGDYIAKDNPNRALTFVHEIRVRCQKIVSFPEAAHDPAWQLPGFLHRAARTRQDRADSFRFSQFARHVPVTLAERPDCLISGNGFTSIAYHT